jgi:hypothetical protein
MQRINEIDGHKYSSRSLVLYHQRLQNYVKQGIIRNFALPEVTDTPIKSKYNAKKVMINDIVFDSINESKFYLYCLYLWKHYAIKDFKLQQEFELQPSYTNHKGNKIRKISYVADFVIYYNDGTKRIIDVKGMETPVFKLKKKLFEYKYPELTLECIRSVTLDMLPPLS